MCGYCCIGIIDFMWDNKSITNFTNVFSPTDYFSLTRLFPYKNRIFDPVLIQKYTGHRKHIFYDILLSENYKKYLNISNYCGYHYDK